MGWQLHGLVEELVEVLLQHAGLQGFRQHVTLLERFARRVRVVVAALLGLSKELLNALHVLFALLLLGHFGNALAEQGAQTLNLLIQVSPQGHRLNLGSHARDLHFELALLFFLVLFCNVKVEPLCEGVGYLEGGQALNLLFHLVEVLQSGRTAQLRLQVGLDFDHLGLEALGVGQFGVDVPQVLLHLAQLGFKDPAVVLQVLKLLDVLQSYVHVRFELKRRLFRIDQLRNRAVHVLRLGLGAVGRSVGGCQVH